MRPIAIGTVGEIEYEVGTGDTARAVGSGTLEVAATPMIAALCERAAREAIEPYLEEGETTVGTVLEMEHSAPTPVGMSVTVRAEVTGVSGREVTFALSVRDGAGEVAAGTHKRFSVNGERFLAKAEKRRTVKDNPSAAK